MDWHYTCPVCGAARTAKWSHVHTNMLCLNISPHFHFIPGPAEQHSAFVTPDVAPPEMIRSVLAIKGDICIVPGCTNRFDVIEHAEPPGMGGTTSVSNLLPICTEHAREKGDMDFIVWLAKRALDPR